MSKDVYILGIESSCDETAAAVVKNGREVLSNIISSQIVIHRKFGGVVPEIASRKHIENILPVIARRQTVIPPPAVLLPPARDRHRLRPLYKPFHSLQS